MDSEFLEHCGTTCFRDSCPSSGPFLELYGPVESGVELHAHWHR